MASAMGVNGAAAAARQSKGSPQEEAIAALEQTEREVATFRRSLTQTAATMLGVPRDKLCSLLRNVWQVSKGQPALTDQEMFQGISMIARYGLDPISREIYVTRSSKGLLTIIGIDGWVKILDRTDHYDGFEQSDVIEDGKVFSITTKIYSNKRSHPTSYTAYGDEYQRICGVVGKAIPIHMLRLFSLRHAARLFTPVGGNVMTEEEAASLMRQDGNGVVMEDDSDPLEDARRSAASRKQAKGSSQDDMVYEAQDGDETPGSSAKSSAPQDDDAEFQAAADAEAAAELQAMLDEKRAKAAASGDAHGVADSAGSEEPAIDRWIKKLEGVRTPKGADDALRQAFLETDQWSESELKFLTDTCVAVKKRLAKTQ